MRAVRRFVDAMLFRVRSYDELSPEGFVSAVVLSFEGYGWSVTASEAKTWLEDYIGAKIGARGYEWTASSARAVVRDYVSEFGEGQP